MEWYTYDYAGNITSTTDANGGTITYHYNSLGQVSEITDQEGYREVFYYDEEGRPELHIDRKGNTVRTRYNMDNRLLYRRAEDAKGRNAVTNQYVYYPDGRLKEAVGGGVTYQYDYTANGQLRSKSSSGKSLLEYAYDRNGNITELKDLTEAVTRYTYDSMNRLLRTGDAKEDKMLAAYSYTPGGQLQSLSYGNNGARTEYTYQDDGQVESLVMMTSDGRVILNDAYAYDGNRNCTRKSGDRDRNEYAYDRMNRLTEAVYNGEKEQFSYDLAGNRLKKASGDQEETYYYNIKNQLVRLEKETGPVCYIYDQQGNMTSEEGSTESHRYGYDAMNRQDRVIIGGATLRYRYDGENLRYETEENGKIIRYLFDRGELAAETAGAKQKSYRRGYRIVSQEEQGNVHYHLQDEMQSTVFILDEEQNTKKSYRYDAFGGIIEERGGLENRITYTGQMYDGVTGQYYLRARFYNPKIGRFLQEDVYRGDGLNLYAYCQNNPVMYYDPSGFELCPHGKTNPQAEQTDGTGQSGTSAYQEYDIVPYDNRKYKTPGYEKHHGILNEWAEHNIGGYTKKNAPTILLTPETHGLTTEIYREWLRGNYGRPVGVSPDWSNMSKTDAMNLTNDMFDVAKVPQNVRNEYFELFDIFVTGG